MPRAPLAASASPANPAAPARPINAEPVKPIVAVSLSNPVRKVLSDSTRKSLACCRPSSADAPFPSSLAFTRAAVSFAISSEFLPNSSPIRCIIGTSTPNVPANSGETDSGIANLSAAVEMFSTSRSCAAPAFSAS